VRLRRRSVLKALGAFASLPLGRLLESSIAQAQTASTPLKFIGVYHPHGLSMECYARRPGETETNFALDFTDSSLTPFDDAAVYGQSFKNRLITFEGVDDAVGELSGTSGHGAASCLFTGSTTIGSDHNAQCESLDYFLGRTKGLGAGTPFPTLNVGVGSVGDVNPDAIAHGAGGAAIRNLVDPVALFDMVFAGLTGTSSDDGAKARAKNQSIIDFIKGDLDSLSGRLGTAEQAKLSQHLDGLRELEQRVTSVATVQACTIPSRPKPTGNSDSSLNFPKVLKWNGGDPYFDRIADVQIDLLAEAVACGLTRFATLFLDDPGKSIDVGGVTLPVDAHNDIAHKYGSGAAKAQLLGRLNRYYYGKIARLMQRLHEGGALASTLIMASSDMGNPAGHTLRNLPLILAGGDGTKLTGPTGKTLAFGRRLNKVADECPASTPYCSPPTLNSHNHVLVSICNLFGVDTDTFGHFDSQYVNSKVNGTEHITGAYPGLLG
jgi:hypothetical protein